MVSPGYESPRVQEPGSLESGQEKDSLLMDYIKRQEFNGLITMLSGVAKLDSSYSGGYEKSTLYRIALAFQEAINEDKDLLIASTVRTVNKNGGPSSKSLLESMCGKLQLICKTCGHMNRREVPTDLVVCQIPKRELQAKLRRTVQMIKLLESEEYEERK